MPTRALLLALLALPTLAADLTVSADFPSASANVLSLDQSTRAIKINPTPHKDRGWQCWWYFKLAGITPGETITLDVGGENAFATPDRAHVSTDAGKTWRHTAPGKKAGKRIVYSIKIDADSALLAWGPPFTNDDAQSLVDRIAKLIDGKDGCRAESFNLANSRENRPVPALRLTPSRQPENLKPRGVLVTARQHAWESGGSWVGVGLAEFLASDDPAAAALRKSAHIVFVPIMDVDNVAIGAGGKNQLPHDHNRDWSDKPVFPPVAACQKIVKDLDAAGQFDLFVDLHNPAPNDKQPFYYIGAKDLHQPAAKANLQTLVDLSKKHITGPLAFKGLLKDSGPGYDKLWKSISGNWVSATCSPHVVATCLETSYNTPDSTIDNYKTVGKQLGATIHAYLAARQK
ncbi:MAG TPA: M14 family zinc carboxypeptidase [Tepidisphaeraceae bacterium]|nr:M14 family zinc carboxypeptidase [Tepidisphaeraceae bacterium]